MSMQISPAALVLDDFVKRYNGKEQEMDFLDCVKEYDLAADWRSVSVSDMSIQATAELSGDSVYGGDAAINMDSYLAVQLPPANGAEVKLHVLRPYTIPALMSLCKDSPPIFKAMKDCGNTSIIARRLNEDRCFLPQDKEFLIRIVGGKVSGCFGDFNAAWTQTEQMAALRSKLNEMFGNHEFLEGTVAHIETRVAYKLGPSIEDAKFLKSTHGTAAGAVLAPYLQTWVEAGLDAEVLKNAVPTLEFRTGESGLAPIALIPSIHYKADGVDTTVLLGPPCKVKHRGSEVWNTYLEYLAGVAAAYQNGIRGWVDLTKTEIKHPYNCLTHIMKTGLRASTPAAVLQATLEAFSLTYPEGGSETCSAFVIYETINDMNSRAAKAVSPTKQLQNMEFTCKMLAPKFNWKRFDLTSPANFGKGPVIVPDED